MLLWKLLESRRHPSRWCLGCGTSSSKGPCVGASDAQPSRFSAPTPRGLLSLFFEEYLSSESTPSPSFSFSVAVASPSLPRQHSYFYAIFLFTF